MTISILNRVCWMFIFILLSVFNITVYSENEEEQVLKNISVQQAHDIVQSNKDNENFALIDLRTAQEYSEEHIDNSKNIDYYSDNFRNELNKLDKEKLYIIHCRSGGRAANTLPIMKELGFKKVYNMNGILQWKEAGFDTVNTTN